MPLLSGEQKRVSSLRLFVLTVLALVAFAGNSLLCRAALRETEIDPASFTVIRIFSGAVVLWVVASARKVQWREAGSWSSALALFGYAAAFSFAYLGLSTGTGALLLFGAVQATMILWGLRRGESLRPRQLGGLLLACSGVAVLVSPGVSAPPLQASILMIAAGIAWGIYSLRAKRGGDPIGATAGNFLRAVPLAAVLGVVLFPGLRVDRAGISYAVASGALASGAGYVIWSTVLPYLKATTAATVQLSVPVIAATGGTLLLGESITLRFLIATIAVLSGIALVILRVPIGLRRQL